MRALMHQSAVSVPKQTLIYRLHIIYWLIYLPSFIWFLTGKQVQIIKTM